MMSTLMIAMVVMSICLHSQVYENLYQAMVSSPKALERPSWWKEVLQKPVVGSLHENIQLTKSKL